MREFSAVSHACAGSFGNPRRGHSVVKQTLKLIRLFPNPEIMSVPSGKYHVLLCFKCRSKWLTLGKSDTSYVIMLGLVVFVVSRRTGPFFKARVIAIRIPALVRPEVTPSVFARVFWTVPNFMHFFFWSLFYLLSAYFIYWVTIWLDSWTWLSLSRNDLSKQVDRYFRYLGRGIRLLQ